MLKFFPLCLTVLIAAALTPGWAAAIKDDVAIDLGSGDQNDSRQVIKSKEPPFTFDEGSRTYPVPVYTIPIPPTLREPAVTPSPYQDFGPAVTPSPYQDSTGDRSVLITNPLGGIANNLVDLIGYLLRIAKGAAAVIAVFMIVYGAYQLLFAAGKPETVKKAGQTILYAVIGLAVVLLSDLIIDIIKKIVNQSPPQ